MPLLAGTRLGPYAIEAPLGAGGMGEVYRAHDPRLSRAVAIKVLPESVARDPDRLARFQREARAVAALSHPNILGIFDFGADNGVTYAVMELIDGETLRRRLAAGALPIRKAIEIAAQLARGLAAAHDAGLVHRDLKPENVIVRPDGQVKILDFGLARATARHIAGDARTLDVVTEPGVTLGTAGYMAPEQVRGLAVDARTDLFALGCVIYELVSGERAFARDTPAETMTAILNEEPPELLSRRPDVLPALDRVVRRCLEKEPAQRFQSAHDLAFALEQAPSASTGSAPAIADARRPRLRLALAAVLLLAAGAAIGRLARPSSAPPLQPKFSALTVESGEESWPSLSPDGASFAYVSGASGNQDIYVRRLDGRNATNLTADSPDADTMPAFSPDGRFIAFRSSRDGGGLFLMQASGENVRRLTNRGYNPAWSPDSRTIAFSTIPSTDPLSLVGKPELWTVTIADGSPRKLTDAPCLQPSWSPDGRRIATWGYRTIGQRFLQTIDAGGGNPTPVFEPTRHRMYWNPIWMPDGWLYYVTNEPGAMTFGRVRVNHAGVATAAPESVIAPAGWAGPAAGSTEGRRIVFQNLTQRYSLARASFDERRGLGEPVVLLSGALGISDIRPSPDGQTVVFSSKGGPGPEDIYTIDADGRRLRQVTSDDPEDRGPAFSEDGRRILFYSNRGGGYGVWSINPDGSGLVELVNGSPATGEDWNYPQPAPHGRLMAYGRAQGLAFFDLSTSPAKLVDRPPPGLFGFFSGAWTPDGLRLVGSLADDLGQPSAERETVIYHADTRTFDRFPHTGVAIAWLADGKRLLIRTDRLELFDPATRARTPVGAWPTAAIQGHLDAQKRTFFFTTRTRDADVWLMDLHAPRAQK